MKKSFNVRALGAGDIAALRAMLSMFGKAFDDVETYSARQPVDSYLENLLSSDTFVALAASSGCKVIGGFAAYVLP
jgi:aminoglycoside 3-N-acetyltransferase I